MRRRRITLEGKAGLNILVEDVLAWLAQPDNIDWLLVLDNMDQYCQQISTTESNPIWNHLRGDHGSVLITTRMSPLMQLGDSKRLNTVDEDVAKAIFEKWYGQALRKSWFAVCLSQRLTRRQPWMMLAKSSTLCWGVYRLRSPRPLRTFARPGSIVHHTFGFTSKGGMN